MVIDFVIVTAPNPPGSRQLMMPGLAVFEIAPANVLQGAVRLHGLASSPTPETQVRVACAWASAQQAKRSTRTVSTFTDSLFIKSSLLQKVDQFDTTLLPRGRQCSGGIVGVPIGTRVSATAFNPYWRFRG